MRCEFAIVFSCLKQNKNGNNLHVQRLNNGMNMAKQLSKHAGVGNLTKFLISDFNLQQKQP